VLPNREPVLPNREPDLPNWPLFCPLPQGLQNHNYSMRDPLQIAGSSFRAILRFLPGIGIGVCGLYLDVKQNNREPLSGPRDTR
jgi:hypothetical protein